MRRRLPSTADVRAAITDARRAMRTPDAPAASAASWSPAEGACRFCGEEQALFAPATAPALVVCARTLAELTVLPAAPSPEAADILDTLERWMASRPGETAPEPAPPSELRCGVCRRAASQVSSLAAGDGVALCHDCALHAAKGRVDPGLADELLAFEIEQARVEVADLDRIRREVKNDEGIRRNPTAVLSLLRLTAVPDPQTIAAIRALVRALDG